MSHVRSMPSVLTTLEASHFLSPNLHDCVSHFIVTCLPPFQFITITTPDVRERLAFIHSVQFWRGQDGKSCRKGVIGGGCKSL